VSPKTRRWATRVGLSLLLAVGLAYLPYRLQAGAGVGDVARLRGELQETRAKIRKLSLDNARYRRDVDALKNDPSAIEDIARDEIGLVHDGELVIRVVGAGSEADR